MMKYMNTSSSDALVVVLLYEMAFYLFCPRDRVVGRLLFFVEPVGSCAQGAVGLLFDL